MRLKDQQKNDIEKYNVMVIDDDPGIIDTICTILDPTKYSIQGFTDPFFALEKLQEEHFDIMILDFLLEKTTGKQVVEEIRQFNTDIYILLLTGYKDMAPPLETLQKLDIQGYCEKGDRFDQLIIMVESTVKSIKLSKKLLAYHEGITTIVSSAPSMYKLRPTKEVISDIFFHFLQITNSENGFFIVSSIDSIEDYQTVKMVQGAGTYHIDQYSLYTLIINTFLTELKTIFTSKEVQYTQNTVLVPLINDIGDEIIVMGVECKNYDELKHILQVFLTNAKSSYKNAILHTVVNKKNHELNAMLQQLKENVEKQKELENEISQIQKMEVLGRLTGGIAHDFNNILTVILTYSNLLLKKFSEDNPDYKKIVNINDAGIRARDLVKQLLAFSKKQKLEKTPVNINQVIISFVNMIERVIGSFIKVDCELDDNLWYAFIDKVQFEQVVMNLAVNARDAMPKGGEIIIQTKNVLKEDVQKLNKSEMKPNDFIKISVSDTGCGIDPGIIQHIFDPFFTTKEKGKGTGLGLSTVYGIIKQMEGYIYVESETGKGTCFSIYVPKNEQKIKKALELNATPTPHGTETILVVDDEKEIEVCVENILSDQGYTVIHTSSPKNAILLFEKNSIDLVLTDMVMPEMSGRNLVQALHHRNPNLKYLFMSGYIINDIIDQGYYHSPLHFLAKPFTSQDLLTKVREILDRREDFLP